MLALLMLVLVFISAVVLAYALLAVLGAKWSKQRRRLQKYLASAAVSSTGQRTVYRRALKRGLKGLWQEISRVFARIAFTRKVGVALMKAGLPLRGEEFITLLVAACFVPALAVFLWSGKLLSSAAAGLCGLLVPLLFLRLRARQRARTFTTQISEAIVLMSSALRTGYSFLQAMEMVAREMGPPISLEFGRAIKEMNYGIGTEEALNHLSARVGSDDLDLIVTAVIIQRQVGGNLAEVLDNIAYTIRERIRIKGEIKTLTAQGRISGMIISVLPLVVGGAVTLLNPGYMQILFTAPLGLALLGGAAVSMLVGMLIIRRIVDIEV